MKLSSENRKVGRKLLLLISLSLKNPLTMMILLIEIFQQKLSPNQQVEPIPRAEKRVLPVSDQKVRKTLQYLNPVTKKASEKVLSSKSLLETLECLGPENLSRENRTRHTQ